MFLPFTSGAHCSLCFFNIDLYLAFTVFSQALLISCCCFRHFLIRISCAGIAMTIKQCCCVTC